MIALVFREKPIVIQYIPLYVYAVCFTVLVTLDRSATHGQRPAEVHKRVRIKVRQIRINVVFKHSSTRIAIIMDNTSLIVRSVTVVKSLWNQTTNFTNLTRHSTSIVNCRRYNPAESDQRLKRILFLNFIPRRKIVESRKCW